MQPGDALLIVDVQNDFCPGGALPVAGGDEVASLLSDVAQRFASAGLPVIAARDWHPAETVHFQGGGGVWPPHCIQGTPGAELHPTLRLPAGAWLVSKGMSPTHDGYSAFDAVAEDGRPLAGVLRGLGVRRLFIGGLATEYCVRASAEDALSAGFAAVVLEDAIRAVDMQPGDGAAALAVVRARGGEVATTAVIDE